MGSGSLHRRLPSPAMVVALIALSVALGGTGYSAVKLNGGNLKNKSVSGKKLKDRTITSTKIKRHTLTATEIRDGSLLSTSFKAGQLPAGPQGPKGDPGSDAFGAITYVRGPAAALANNEFATVDPVVALCPSGQVPLGGGVQNGNNPSSDDTAYYVLLAYSHPHLSAAGRPDGWMAGVSHRPGTSFPYNIWAWVACAPAGNVTGP